MVHFYVIIYITHGFRSFPFVFFTAAIFLQALRDVEIKAVYYGMLPGGPDPEGPMVDLSLILDMVEWFYATRIFKETGQAHHLNRMLTQLEVPPDGLPDHARAPYSKIKALRKSLNNFTTCYMQALPLELGLVSAEVMHQLSRIEFTETMRQSIPVPNELMNIVRDFIEHLALPSQEKKATKDKTKIVFDGHELDRQARLIDYYLEQGYLHYAIGIMREWMVSTALMYNAVTTGVEDKPQLSWLVYEPDRKPIEDQLNYLANIIESKNSEDMKLFSDEQKWLGSKWLFLRNKRNPLAHHGYCEDYSLQSETDVKEIRELWKELKERSDNCSWWRLGMVIKSRYKTLVSPLGLSKGLLFSALKHIQPHQAVVITSQQSAVDIQEIVEKTGWRGDLTVKTMKKPFTGFDEMERIMREIQPVLWNSEEVIFNITGGTTAMQYIVQEVADHVAKQQLPLKMMALVDRRSPEKQKANPYVLGEIVWLKNKNDSE